MRVYWINIVVATSDLFQVAGGNFLDLNSDLDNSSTMKVLVRETAFTIILNEKGSFE